MSSPAKELYRVFKPYRVDSAQFYAGSCDHCVPQVACERLATTPLDELTVADLDRYAQKAMTTWGGVREFKYFLPRLLELTLDHYGEFCMPETLLGKLECAQWRTWEKVEQQAVGAFLSEFWRRQLARPILSPQGELTEIRTVLGGLAEACGSVQLFLEDWLKVPGEAAALHLAQFLSQNADEIFAKSRVYLWGRPEQAVSEVVQWLRTAEVQNYLQSHRPRIEAEFSFTLDLLTGIRSRNTP